MSKNNKRFAEIIEKKIKRSLTSKDISFIASLAITAISTDSELEPEKRKELLNRIKNNAGNALSFF